MSHAIFTQSLDVGNLFLNVYISFIPISFIVFQDNTNTQNGNKNS